MEREIHGVFSIDQKQGEFIVFALFPGRNQKILTLICIPPFPMQLKTQNTQQSTEKTKATWVEID